MSQAMTTTMSRVLAVIPVAALAAACGGPAPTAPSDLSPSALVGSNESGSVTAMKTGDPCEAIVGIDLKVVDTSRTVLWVEATYQFIAHPFAACAAPSWSSNRTDMIVDRTNPYRAGFPRSATGTAILTATAPNGVHNSIRLTLGYGDNCNNVVGVDLRLLSSADDNVVQIQAAYVFLGDTPDNCTVAPTFTASRRGLRVNPRDAFQAAIDAAPGIKTTVAATAPNGVGNKIEF